jgi:hypothetical protein
VIVASLPVAKLTFTPNRVYEPVKATSNVAVGLTVPTPIPFAFQIDVLLMYRAALESTKLLEQVTLVPEKAEIVLIDKEALFVFK